MADIPDSVEGNLGFAGSWAAPAWSEVRIGYYSLEGTDCFGSVAACTVAAAAVVDKNS